MTLTDLQRHALYLSSLKGGALVVRKRTSGGKHVTTRQANVLERKGLVTRHEDILLITKAGRRELNAVLPEGPPTFLKVRDGLTTRMDLRVREEMEVMDASRLRPDWALVAEQGRQLARADADATRLSGLSHPEELARELRRLASERGIDVSDELRFVERAVRALERKVRGNAA
jgi:DNA-binding MarR family transcriptional regulator